ncbi:hypothetical protein ACFQ4C_29465, partial [Larkinella insperata]
KKKQAVYIKKGFLPTKPVFIKLFSPTKPVFIKLFHRPNLCLLPTKPVFIKVIHTLNDCKSYSYVSVFRPTRD